MKNNLWKTWLSFKYINFTLISNTYRLVFFLFYLVLQKLFLIVHINRIAQKEHACSEEDSSYHTDAKIVSAVWKRKSSFSRAWCYRVHENLHC